MTRHVTRRQVILGAGAAAGVAALPGCSDTPEVRSLYKGFKLTEIDVRRNISAVGSKRGTASELVVTNAASWT